MTEHKTFSPEHAGAPQDARDAVRARLEVERSRELTWLRDAMKKLFRMRAGWADDPYVNADDAAYCYTLAVEQGMFPPANRAFLGQVFKAPGWERTNLMVKSRQPKNHARLLNCWKYEGE